MRNKRGQFFLIAALIIIALVIGFATAVNSVRVGEDDEAFYDLADEVGFETKKVLDYGVFNEKEINPLMEGFLENYTDYIAQEEVLFIFGNATGIQGLVFKEIEGGGVGISTGDIPGTITIQYTTHEQAEVTRNGDLITVKINEIIYEFNLRDGQNFFFVVGKEENGEKFVAKG